MVVDQQSFLVNSVYLMRKPGSTECDLEDHKTKKQLPKLNNTMESTIQARNARLDASCGFFQLDTSFSSSCVKSVDFQVASIL